MTGRPQIMPDAKAQILAIITRAAKAGQPLTHEMLRARVTGGRDSIRKYVATLRDEGLVNIDMRVRPAIIVPVKTETGVAA